MKWFKNLRISVKLISTFLVIALLAGGLGLFSIVVMTDTNEKNSQVFENYGNSQGYLSYVSTEFQKQRSMYRDIILDKNFETSEAKITAIEESDKVLLDNLAKYEVTCLTDEEKAIYTTLKTDIESYFTVRGQILDPIQEADYGDRADQPGHRAAFTGCADQLRHSRGGRGCQ